MSVGPQPTVLEVTEPLVLEVTAAVDTVGLSLAIPHDLRYFRGHFPTLAVLPGVVQIDWVMNYGRRHFALGEVAVRTLRIKFRRLIRPGDRLLLTLAYQPARKQIEFSYADSEGILSSGRIELEPA
jgi:3-hydroxymyristoyl/3-hydroxydecanoyl-(acyl carrier protein) dehydratase